MTSSLISNTINNLEDLDSTIFNLLFPVETDNLRDFKNYDGYIERELYIDFDYENNTIISKNDVSRLRGSILKAFKKYNLFNELFPFAEKYVDNSTRGFIILHSSFHIFGGDESFDHFQELTSMDIYNSWFKPRIASFRKNE